MIKLEKYKTLLKFKILLHKNLEVKTVGYIEYEIKTQFIIKYIQINTAFRGKGYGKAALLPYKHFITSNIAKKKYCKSKIICCMWFYFKK